jgi:glycosyltransferase involved in cell wall biosynthesis
MSNFFIIIPCYNEGKRLDYNHFYSFSQQNKGYKLLFINDGSKDNTLDIIKKLSSVSNNISFLNYKKNRGKSYAVRYGILNVLDNHQIEQISYIGFLDADLSISTDDMGELYEKATLHPEFGFLYYMKNKKTYYKKRYLRFLISNILKIMNRILYNINIEDTQCGCKIFKRDVAEIVFRKQFNSKWLFDLEIFLRLKESYGSSFMESASCGVLNKKIAYVKKSKIKTTIAFLLLTDYLKIYIKS